jgi:hypothetical protein
MASGGAGVVVKETDFLTKAVTDGVEVDCVNVCERECETECET